MVRCAQCGRRFPGDAPVCAEHGEERAAASASEPVDEAALQLEARAYESAARALAARGIRIGAAIGRGGFGVVHVVERQDAPTPLVIKLARRERSDAAQRLAREAIALEEVGPPHVPKLFAHGAEEELAYLLMERIDVPTLAERMRRPTTSALELRALGHALFDAVAAIHARGIVHLDLKPENIFVSERRACVIDFGLCTRDPAARSDADPLGPAFAPDEALGTAEYMAPEQCRGGALDRRADLYSLGVLLYELASGAPPFFGAPADVREAHESARPRPLSARLGLPRALDDVIRRCLAKEPSRRYDDVDGLRRAFDVALATQVQPASLTAARGDAASAASTLEKRAVGLLFFASHAGLASVRTAVASGAGGELVHHQGSDYVAAFSHDVGENPVRSALRTAERLLASHVAERALVELATVSVQRRPDGSRRMVSALFSKRDRYPTERDPATVLLTREAAEVLADLPLAPLAGRLDRFTLDRNPLTQEHTVFALEPTPLFGRDGLLAALCEGATQTASARRPGLHTVIGGAGLGKSHLARALAARLLADGKFEVLRASARDGTSEEARLLPELLRRALALPPSQLDLESTRRLLRERLGDDEQVITAALLALELLDREQRDVRRLAAAPGALRVASARAASLALQKRAATRPLVVIVDDAHLVEDAALDALELATLDDAAAPLWVVAFARDQLLQARPGFGKRAATHRHDTLPPLAAEGSEQLARALLRPVEHVPPDALARLAERTQGVPALLVELVRGLKREGLVRRSERGTGYYLATDALERLPELPIVAWNATREVEALPAPLAEHARLASVLGTSFQERELDALLARAELAEGEIRTRLDTHVGLERLVEAGVLVRRRGQVYAFRHALLAQTIYQRLPEPARRELHRLALEVFQELPESERRLAQVARHAAECGERTIAAEASLALARRAQSAQAYLEAEGAFGHALAQLAELAEARGPRVTMAARGRGLMRFRLGRHEDALSDLVAAEEAADEHATKLELLLDQATVLDWIRDFSASAAITERATALAQGCSELSSARLAMSRARVHHRRAEAEPSVRLGSEAAERARLLGDEGYETRIGALLMVAPDCVTLGRLDEAEQHFDAVIAEAAQHGDMHHLGAAHNNRALLWLARRDARRLFEDLAHGARIARELGAPLIEYPARINMGEVAYALEQLEQAREHTERAIVLARQLWGEGNRELGMCELLLARIALDRGELTTVRALCAGMQRRMEEARRQGSTECDFLPAEQALLELVELGAREGSEAEWDALEQRCRAIDLQPQEQLAVLESRALAALRAGRRADAERVLTRAVALSEAQPNLWSERVLRRYAEHFTAGAPHAPFK